MAPLFGTCTLGVNNQQQFNRLANVKTTFNPEQALFKAQNQVTARPDGAGRQFDSNEYLYK